MPGKFFDTNVLIYLASADPVKADVAENLIGQGGTISVQVLNESPMSPAARCGCHGRKRRLSCRPYESF
jgi:predicted nucleic acid-binding protein